MSRLGVFYALNEEELQALRDLPEEERFQYMLDEIESRLFGGEFGCEMDKAWEGVQYCLGGGVWSEENRVPLSIVFGGEFLVNRPDEIITLKTHRDIGEILEFLSGHDLEALLRANFEKIPQKDYSLPRDGENLEYLIGWSRGLRDFYERASRARRQVIFTVDL